MQTAVEIQRNGMVLRGMLHRPDKCSGKVPMALIFHGFTGNKMEPHFIFVKLSRMLEKAGIASLRFDFLGSGESDGEFKDMTLSTEVEDALCILDYAMSLDFVDKQKIFAVGLSMGGAVASILAGRRNRNIAALCLWAAAGNIGELIRTRVVNEMGGLEGLSLIEHIDMGGNDVGRDFFHDVMAVDVYEEAAQYSGKVLLIHGDADVTVPISAAHSYAETYKDKCRLHILSNADHTFNKKEWESEVLEETVNFLRDNI